LQEAKAALPPNSGFVNLGQSVTSTAIGRKAYLEGHPGLIDVKWFVWMKRRFIIQRNIIRMRHKMNCYGDEKIKSW
jgi:hypothetical protein